MNDTNHLEVIASGLSAGGMILYLDPGMMDLCPEACTVPASLEALATFLGSKVTVPGRARGNLGASAQHIENFKYRKTLVDLMCQAFAPTLTLHRRTGRWRRCHPFRSWCNSGMTMPCARRWLVAPTSDSIQGVSQSERFGTWYHAMEADGAELNALADRTMVLYQPSGAAEPRQNFLVSDADFVEVLTEIDIQTPVPPLVQERRRDRASLSLGCRFTSQTERIFAHQISQTFSEAH